MKNPTIKIIKRKDAVVIAECDPQLGASIGEEPIEPFSRRKINATVSSWVSARRKPTRKEEVAAVHRVFGKETLFGAT